MALTVEGRARKDILDAAFSVGQTGAHLAPSLSLVEIAIAVLKNKDPERDSFILSKGHGALGYYAVMHQLEMITDEQFQSFEVNGGEFPGQPSRSSSNGIEYSSGSLGMGLSYGVGVAYAKRAVNGKVYVVLGDGELNEGSIWEAASLASQLKLGNLIAVVDNNGMQSDGFCEEIINMDMMKLWTAHGWHVVKCNGHSVEELEAALKEIKQDHPLVVLGQTIKGKGVSFMEKNNEWHHHVLKEQEYWLAVNEIGERYGLCEE
jgi:Transketolase, N-terminal subunit